MEREVAVKKRYGKSEKRVYIDRCIAIYASGCAARLGQQGDDKDDCQHIRT
jgi:hypothetical protein